MDRALEVISWATIVVLLYALVGAIQVVIGDLAFEEYVRIMDLPVAGLAVGRGIAAHNRRG